MNCSKCGLPVHEERAELGLKTCRACASNSKPFAVMVYSHKTAGVLELVESEEAFKALKGAADERVEAL